MPACRPDRFQLLRPWLLSSLSLAVIVTATAAFDAALSPALAQACTPAPPTPDAAGNATCTAGTYNSNINYDTTATNGPINLTLDPGAFVNSPGGNAVNAANTTGTTSSSANIAINANGPIIIDDTANPGGNNQSGLRIQSSGNASIAATNTTISVNGTQSDNAIWAIVLPNTTPTPHSASVNWSGPSITSIGANSTDIQADNRGVGDATIVASGNISGSVGTAGGFTFIGLDATAADTTSAATTVLGGRRDILGVAPAGIAGDASVTYNSGTINVQGNFAAGIFASADAGSATITTRAGTSIIVGQQFSTDTLQPAIDAFSSSGAATDTVASTIEINDSSSPQTDYRLNPTAVRATSDLSGPVSVTYTGPGITVHGGGGLGIVALTGDGSTTVNASGGPIIADGSNAIGILADSGTIRNTVKGRPVETTTGPVQVTANNVSASGEFGVAISATGGSGGVMVTLPSGGSIMGGWQADVASVGSAYGLPAAGVILGSSVATATLINDGTIGALSDRAVASSPLLSSNNTGIINNGTITGFEQLVGGNNSIVNNGTFNLRHFADTNGDGIRDTLRVAVTDLGPGTFTNNRTLALLGGPGATTLDAAGQYLPLGLTFNAMALGGPVQGQILGATTFVNSGIIDLQANPVPGDVLLISGGHTPGISGGGVFVANGGQLLLDTVLNEGGSNSRSDVLVVDGTSVGAGGATRLFAKNAGGAGALTVGDGIAVVQVLDPSRSAGGVFTLGAPDIAGPYEYTLFHGGVGADATNGNWYLRSTLNCALAPNLPECQVPSIPPSPITGPIPTPPIPNFRVETSLYAAIPSMALLYGRNLLDTLHERVGEEFSEGAVPAANPTSPYLGWGRIIGMSGVQQGASQGVLSAGTGGPHYDYGFFGLQAGMDLLRLERPDGSRDHAGTYFAVGSDQGTVTHFDGRQGDSDFNAYSLGGYWTHFGASGWYTDTILQGTFYDINSTANRGLRALTTDGDGIAASIEGGYPFKLGNGYFIEPQAQLIYQNININNTADIAAQIHFSDVDSLLGRIGARFGRTWNIDDSSRAITAWIRTNLWNEFQGNPTTSFSSQTVFVPFFADLGGLWGEINVGVSGQITNNTSLFANASYQSRFDGGGFAYTGKAGLRVNW